MTTKTETFQVSGMSCPHCANTVKNMVNKLQGIQAVDVNLNQGVVQVTYEKGKTDTEAIEGAIVGAGYDIVKQQ